MGNSGSQAAPSEQASVFSLSQELQGAYKHSRFYAPMLVGLYIENLIFSFRHVCVPEQMAQEYNNEQIVKLFGKQMEKLGERKSALLKEKVEQRTIMERHMEQFRAQNKSVHEQLDQAIESFEDQFTDTVNVLEFDASRLEKKYLDGKFTNASDIPCLAERSDMATCYKAHRTHPGACDAFIEALTECATKTITAK